MLRAKGKITTMEMCNTAAAQVEDNPTVSQGVLQHFSKARGTKMVKHKDKLIHCNKNVSRNVHRILAWSCRLPKPYYVKASMYNVTDACQYTGTISMLPIHEVLDHVIK